MSNFKKEFLDNYLKFGLGSMPKSDIDALVMHLLGKYGHSESEPLSNLRNQEVSQRLKTPVSKVKSLRYSAALKFGESVENQAMGRLLAALSEASLEDDKESEKIHLIIEDSLARNWLQGKLKDQKLIFDHSFNTEIIKISSSGLFVVLESLFDKNEIEAFKSTYEIAKKKSTSEASKKAFKAAAKKFAEGAAKQAGSGVVAVLKAQLGTV